MSLAVNLGGSAGVKEKRGQIFFDNFYSNLFVSN
jgi:hypothetical protein